MEGYHEIDSLNDRLLNESLETEENVNEENSTGPRITGKNYFHCFFLPMKAFRVHEKVCICFISRCGHNVIMFVRRI